MKTYDFKQFVQGDHLQKKQPPTLSILPLVAAPLMPTAVYAAEESIKTKMMSAFNPLIDLIQGLAYPVAMVVVLGGSIFVMIGNSDKGFSMMQKAGLGYLLIMITPMILDVLVDAMDGAL